MVIIIAYVLIYSAECVVRGVAVTQLIKKKKAKPGALIITGPPKHKHHTSDIKHSPRNTNSGQSRVIHGINQNNENPL
ncbi:hypothetical protein VTN00DRAFT_7031 [Thermoascus crustaceus]|uniref:uncharacterized protein n=1 Tax=Thermoascus crustaceus TaxID=5088 RepID=UPI00374207B9